jgi:hypothetical protein
MSETTTEKDNQNKTADFKILPEWKGKTMSLDEFKKIYKNGVNTYA